MPCCIPQRVWACGGNPADGRACLYLSFELMMEGGRDVCRKEKTELRQSTDTEHQCSAQRETIPWLSGQCLRLNGQAQSLLLI